MRSELSVIALLFGLASPFLAGLGSAAPEMPKEVEVVMDSNEGSATPLEGKPFFFYQHGVVKWNTTTISASVLEVWVELLVIGLGMGLSIEPLPIVLTRSDPEFDFNLIISIPANCPAQEIEYTIQGYYYHAAYPADQRMTDTVPMKLTVEPYSLIAFRDFSEGDSVKIPKKEWTTIEISLWNKGNADDIYKVSIECLGPAKVRFDRASISVPRDEFNKFQFEVYAESSEPAIVVFHVETEHPVVNDTGEMRFTLYVDETSDLLNENFNVIVGSVASLFMVISVVVIIVILIKRRMRSHHPPRGHG